MMSNEGLKPPSFRAQSRPHVLETIFENLTNKNLFVCRLVCTSWAQEAGRVFGKRLDKIMCAPTELKALRQISNGSDIGIRLKKVYIRVPAFCSINDIPSQAYDTVTSLDLECFPSLIPHFVFHLFPKLESLYLTLTYDDNGSRVEPAGAYSWEQSSLPKLPIVKLELWLVFVPSESSWKSLLESLLEKAGNLETYVVSYVKTVNATTFIDKLCSSKLRSIKIFDADVSATIITALSAHLIHFPLETIDLKCIDNDSVDKEDIKLLLNRFSLTLRHLRLRFLTTFKLNFPLGVRMEKLHTLRMHDFCGSMEWKKLPQLKKLILLHSNFERIASSISHAPQLCRLQDLTIFIAKDERTDFIRSFQNVAENLGPQLKSLQLIAAFCRPLLSVICSKLTQLSRLTLAEVLPNSDSIRDPDLCGAESLMFTPPVERLFGLPLNERYESMIASAKASNHARGPNITDLKELQFLALQGAFTEVAVLHGVVHCKALRELILVSDACRNTRDWVVHLVVNADLKRLTRLELNGERINHLRFAPGLPPNVVNPYEIFFKMLE